MFAIKFPKINPVTLNLSFILCYSKSESTKIAFNFLAARLSKLKNNRRQCLLDLIFVVRLSTIRKCLVFLALSYLIILFQVIPDWVNEVLPSSLHHTCMNQKTKIRWFDTQLETRENLPFRFSGYKPIIINPIKRFNSLNYLPSQEEAAEASENEKLKPSHSFSLKPLII